MKQKLIIGLFTACVFLGGCAQDNSHTQKDMAALQQAILQKQDLLLTIHLELDSAAHEISQAQLKAEEGNCSGAEYHAAEAYRKLRDADDAILDLGRDLQTLIDLDTEKGNI